MAEPLLTIAICAKNEERTLAQVIQSVLRLKSIREIIVVDDGSTDRTHEIASSFLKRTGTLSFGDSPQSSCAIKVFRHSSCQGKGAALQTAVQNTEGEYFAIQDADLEYEPSLIDAAVKHMQKNNLDVIFGSRFLRENPTRYPLFLWGNKAVSWWISFLTRTKITDAYTGTKVFRAKIIKEMGLRSLGFEVEAEMAAKVGRLAHYRKIRYGEIPIPYHPRTKEEGKKIRIIDGFTACCCALSCRLSKI